MPAPKRHDRLRGRAGVAQRKTRLERTKGLCERCAGIGRWVGRTPKRTTAATVVNHIIPLVHGGSDDDANTENLCRPCDIIVTAEQFGQRIVQPIGNDGWPIE